MLIFFLYVTSRQIGTINKISSIKNVPASGVVLDTTSKGKNRNAGDKDQNQNGSLKEIVSPKIVLNLRRRLVINKEWLMLYSKMMTSIKVLYLAVSKIVFWKKFRVVRIMIISIQNMEKKLCPAIKNLTNHD